MAGWGQKRSYPLEISPQMHKLIIKDGIMIYISIALAVAPAILLTIYFYKKDSLKPEPKKMIVFAFLAGIASTIPAIIAGMWLNFLENTPNAWAGVFVQSFITAALVEELSKFLLFRLFIYGNKNFDEITDGIVYMAIISLGFACFENILYSAGDLSTGIIRAVTAVPGHAFWSGIMGYYFALAKRKGKGSGSLIIKGLGLGILYHGLYDFVLFAGINPGLEGDWSWLSFCIFPILILCAVHLHRLLKKAREAYRAALQVEPNTGNSAAHP
jgi:protease PrsW